MRKTEPADGEATPTAQGKVLIIYNSKTENEYSRLEGPARLAKLKEIYVKITMGRRGETEEQATARYNTDVRGNPEEIKFQTHALLKACPVAGAAAARDDAKRIAIELGYREEDIIVLENKSKQEIGKALKELKQEAMNAEKDHSVKAQAFLIINIGHMLNPVAHKDLMSELGHSYAFKFEDAGYFSDY